VLSRPRDVYRAGSARPPFTLVSLIESPSTTPGPLGHRVRVDARFSTTQSLLRRKSSFRSRLGVVRLSLFKHDIFFRVGQIALSLRDRTDSDGRRSDKDPSLFIIRPLLFWSTKEAISPRESRTRRGSSSGRGGFSGRPGICPLLSENASPSLSFFPH